MGDGPGAFCWREGQGCILEKNRPQGCGWTHMALGPSTLCQADPEKEEVMTHPRHLVGELCAAGVSCSTAVTTVTRLPAEGGDLPHEFALNGKELNQMMS